jgi:hypothetical protein
MTPEQKMQKVVEAAGECWHESGTYFDGVKLCKCLKCGVQILTTNFHKANPSPTDLNELFRLAEKMSKKIKVEQFDGDWVAQVDGRSWEVADTPAEALLNALFVDVS